MNIIVVDNRKAAKEFIDSPAGRAAIVDIIRSGRDRTKGEIMHYKNGRPAKTGDPVIVKDYQGNIHAGIIHSLVNADTCNATIACPIPGGCSQAFINLKDSYHAEDAFNSIDRSDPPPISSVT